MPKKIQVTYADLDLGEISVYGTDDWKNPSRAPDERDFLTIRSRAVSDFLHEVLARHPLQSHPKEPDVPWPVVVLRRACVAVGHGGDRKLEEEAMRTYLHMHGLDRFVQLWGGDPAEVQRELEARHERG